MMKISQEIVIGLIVGIVLVALGLYFINPSKTAPDNTDLFQTQIDQLTNDLESIQSVLDENEKQIEVLITENERLEENYQTLSENLTSLSNKNVQLTENYDDARTRAAISHE